MSIRDDISKLASLKKSVLEAFGYEEQWRSLEIEDNTDCYWFSTNRSVYLAKCPFTEDLIKEGKELYTNELMGFRGSSDGLVMMDFDTNTDFNRFLGIFDTSKQCKDLRLIELAEECW